MAKTQLSPDHMTPPPLRQALMRTLLRIVIIGLGAVAFHAVMVWLLVQFGEMQTISDQAAITGLLILVLLGYSVLIALPFMPGIEIGIALLMLQGAAIAPWVYLATLIGLFLAYLIGRHIPLGILHNMFRDLHMRRACGMIARIKRTPQQHRLQQLQSNLPRVLTVPLVNYRYVMLATLINIPGNFVIGGGGGIMMLAGVTRLFHWTSILLTLGCATLPIPLAVYLMGRDIVAPLAQ